MMILFICCNKLGKKEVKHTSLLRKAKMTAPACSAALPTIGNNIIPMNPTDNPHESAASYPYVN